MFAVSCDNASELEITAVPDGTIDGALAVEIISGDGTLAPQDPATPLVFVVRSGTAVVDPADPTGAAGQTVFRVTGDVRVGPAVVTITEDVILTVTAVPAAEATTFGLQVSAPRPKGGGAAPAAARSTKR
jgi:hypothetical protein